MGTETMREPRPWVHWPTITSTARSNGWKILAERHSEARMERRDSRSPDGAATLHVEFDRDGLIADASIAELDLRLAAHETDKLSTILDWLREPAPPASA